MSSTRTVVTGLRGGSGSSLAVYRPFHGAQRPQAWRVHIALPVRILFLALTTALVSVQAAGCTLDFSDFKAKVGTSEPDIRRGDPCGNAKLDEDETCDKAIKAGTLGACPERCDDGTGCAPQVLEGEREKCTAVCVVKPITKAINGDSCCPPEVTPDEDSDCADCNNGEVDPGETCDDGEGSPKPCPKTPEDCGESSGTCTDFEVVGGNCQYLCLSRPREVVDDKDGCCPPGGNNNIDKDCPPACNNGAVEGRETCDPMAEEGCVTPDDCVDSDKDSCTVETFEGSADTCTARCVTTKMITEPDADAADGCCPSGVPAEKDADCVASCTNSVLDRGELCDDGPMSSKPCDDEGLCTSPDACVRATFVPGAGDEYCHATCELTEVTECAGGDGCCPSGCTAVQDEDCSDACGNGVLETDKGEKCDPGIEAGTQGACPSECPPGDDPCRPSRLSGSAQRCTASCEPAPITTCDNDVSDGCCNAEEGGCNANNDVDCEAVCGNLVREEGETCDQIDCDQIDCDDRDPCTIDSPVGEPCKTVCEQTPIEVNEDDDGCCLKGATFDEDNDCATVCGDGKVQGTEFCDDGRGSPQPCPQRVSDCKERTSCTTEVTIVGKNCEARCEYQSDPICDITLGLVAPLP